jgi:GT2 family glycosyltransferase
MVIDNQSPDGSGSKLESVLAPEEFLQLPVNIGYAGGNNEGMRLAMSMGADYIFIVNPDVRLEAGCINTYIESMETDEKIFALNPIQINGEGEIDKFFGREMFESNGHKIPALPLANELVWEVKTLFGAAIFISRAAIEKVGGFDPLYFAYWEEIDLCRRIKYHGGKLVVISSSPVMHLRSYVKRTPDPRRQFLRLKGSYLFILKDFNRSLHGQLKIVVREVRSSIINGSKGEFGWTRWQHLLALLWCIANLLKIARHRVVEKSGRSHV